MADLTLPPPRSAPHTDQIADQNLIVEAITTLNTDGATGGAELPPGGGTAQILAKDSPADGDVAWVDAPVVPPVTYSDRSPTSGDIAPLDAVWVVVP